MIFDWNSERPDMQLEHDRQQGIIADNYAAELNKEIPEQPFASEGEGFKVSEIVKNLTRKGGGRALYYNHQIEWDMELEDAREAASFDAVINTPSGFDAPPDMEQIQVSGHSKGHEYEIIVEIFE